MLYVVGTCKLHRRARPGVPALRCPFVVRRTRPHRPTQPLRLLRSCIHGMFMCHARVFWLVRVCEDRPAPPQAELHSYAYLWVLVRLLRVSQLNVLY